MPAVHKVGIHFSTVSQISTCTLFYFLVEFKGLMKREQKKKVIGKHSLHPKDTGSHQVQVAVLTERISELSKHLETHPKDNHSRRGLLMMVGKRRKLLNYLKTSDKKNYEELLEKLNLRK